MNAPVHTATAAAGVEIVNNHLFILSKAELILLQFQDHPKQKKLEN